MNLKSAARVLIHRRTLYLFAILAVALALELYPTLLPDALATDYVISPVQRLLTSTANAPKRFQDYLTERSTLIDEHRRLETENALLKVELELMKRHERENDRLRALLALQSRFGFQAITAQVVGRSPDDWFETLTVNRGREDGVADGMVVVAPTGLIGRVRAAHARTALIELITAPNSRIGVLVNRTREMGVTRGMIGKLLLDFIEVDADLVEGDLLLTSGLSGIYPKDLVVGRVKTIENSSTDLFKSVEVEPVVNLGRLEEVMILRPQLGADGEG
ncbi:MAG: rod shape-determining protein MreC [Candidatus Bipolaricaulia bacterium]